MTLRVNEDLWTLTLLLSDCAHTVPLDKWVISSITSKAYAEIISMQISYFVFKIQLLICHVICKMCFFVIKSSLDRLLILIEVRPNPRPNPRSWDHVHNVPCSWHFRPLSHISTSHVYGYHFHFEYHSLLFNMALFYYPFITISRSHIPVSMVPFVSSMPWWALSLALRYFPRIDN